MLFGSLGFSAKLPELTTKQKLANIRFLSKDNRYTYYQNQSGNLQIATNFSAHVILKKNPDTEYFLSGDKESKKIIVEIHESFFDKSSMFPRAEFGYIEYGGHEYKFLGNGVSPKLHLNGTWYSYYEPNQKMIFINSIQNSQLGFKIELKNPVSPFFIPTVLMIDTREILFTDINNRGEMGILYFDRGQNVISPVYKSTTSGSKIEMCKLNGRIVVGEFSRVSLYKRSKIFSAEWSPNTQLKVSKEHYRSGQNDIGKIQCHEETKSIFFIQNLSDSSDNILEKSELVQLNYKSNALRVISDLKNVSHIINMDGRIIIPFREKIYVGFGKSDAFSDKLEIKKK